MPPIGRSQRPCAPIRERPVVPSATPSTSAHRCSTLGVATAALNSTLTIMKQDEGRHRHRPDAPAPTSHTDRRPTSRPLQQQSLMSMYLNSASFKRRQPARTVQPPATPTSSPRSPAAPTAPQASAPVSVATANTDPDLRHRGLGGILFGHRIDRRARSVAPRSRGLDVEFNGFGFGERGYRPARPSPATSLLGFKPDGNERPPRPISRHLSTGNIELRPSPMPDQSRRRHPRFDPVFHDGQRTRRSFVSVRCRMRSDQSGVGSLVDADMNVASTRLQALQTQQQLGIQSLSIAKPEQPAHPQAVPVSVTT